jgi:hypothetical protein
VNPDDNEPFALSPEDEGPGVPARLAPGGQSLDHAEGLDGPGQAGAAPPQATGADAGPAPEAGAAPATSGLKKRVIPDPPEIDQAKGRKTFWFLVAVVLVAVVVMAAVGTLNTLADPYGLIGMKLLPTVTTSDRTIKADAIQSLKRPPQLVVLGSSRSMRYMPSHFEEVTGLRTFNAGVEGIGGTADAWAMVNFIHDTFPDSDPKYFWLLDVESFVPYAIQGRTANEPRLAQYVEGSGTVRKTPASVLKAAWSNRSSVLSLASARDSLRILMNRPKVKKIYDAYRKRFQPDGTMVDRPWTPGEWKKRWPRSLKRYTDLYKNAYHGLDPTAKRFFEKTLAFMNGHGATPLIVLTPINPKLLKYVGPLGWDQRHQQVLDYLDSLKPKYKFEFIDITDITTWGGDPNGFYDGVHMTVENTAKATDYVLKQMGGLPR